MQQTISKEQIREGMSVRTADGREVGKVLECRSDDFIVEKGFLFPKDYVAGYDEVTDIENDWITLTLNEEDFPPVDNVHSRPRGTIAQNGERIEGPALAGKETSSSHGTRGDKTVH
jgi:hypothetical protein